MRPVKSVRNALRVFEEVAFRQPVGVSELARVLGLPKPSVQRALTTMRDAGWLRQPPGGAGRWVVAARFSLLADAAPELVAIRQAAAPHLADLRDRTRESVGLFALDGDHVVLVESEQSRQVVRAVDGEPGPMPLHRTAAGRAILAHLPEPRRELLLTAATAPANGDVAADPDGLAAELEATRRRGYAVSVRESHDELAGVSAAVFGPAGWPVAALTVFGPAHRFDDPGVVAEVGGAVAGACAAVSDDVRSLTPSAGPTEDAAATPTATTG